MNKGKGLLILGFGGHARSVADVALATGIKQLLFVDPNASKGEKFIEFPVQREVGGELLEGWLCFAASGKNEQRKEQIEMAKLRGWPLATLVAPTASIGIGSYISPGSFVAHHAHIGPMSKIGLGSIINTGAIVEHECIIGDYCHISINASIAGRSTIGDLTSIFASAVVIDSRKICEDVVVGSGSVVINNIQESGTYVGVPTRLINKSK